MTDTQSITAQRATITHYIVDAKLISGIHYHFQAMEALACDDPESDIAALQSYARAFSDRLSDVIAAQGGDRHVVR